MAKVYPYAEIPVLDGDLPLSETQFHDVSFLSRLARDRREKLLKYPGAMRLRRVSTGQVICRQNEEGSTAYFILRGGDIYRVMSILVKRDDPEAVASRERIAKIVGAMPPDRRATYQRAFLADKEMQKRRQAAQDRLDARIAAEAALKKLITEKEKGGDKDRAAALKAMMAATPDKKLQNAAAVASSDPTLAALLRDHALSPAEVKALQQDEEFYRTSDAEEKRAKAKELDAKDPALAAQLRASAEGEEDAPPFAQVQLSTTTEPTVVGGVFSRFKRWFLGKREVEEDGPRFLPSDSPTELDSKTRKASLFEGDLFGEMACLNRRARSATVTAVRDGYVLEILGNVLDEIDKDPDYQKERQRVYRRRVLELHLRELALFRDLSPSEYALAIDQIRENVELVSFASGQVICDEHDRSDAIYLVRDGMVQVTKNTSALLRKEDVRNWLKFAEQIRTAAGPAAAVVKLLPAPVLKLIQEAPLTGPIKETQDETLFAVNELIKSPKLAQLAELKTLLESDSYRRRAFYLPVERKVWTESQTRRGQRLILEELFPDSFEPLPTPSASGDFILTYLSRGDIFGEIGVVENVPRTASCIAYGQPRIHTDQKDLGRVELVRISRNVIRDLLIQFPIVREKIGQLIQGRRLTTEKALQKQAVNQGLEPETRQTEEASRLGLIQGQKLMLIDLDRCTRCDECVKACVDSHDDGRTRLFLAGPRFGKYLIPHTCRACLDPVCMIGCPVKSIMRGDNLEIQIKDWCIGCGICARQCPYNAIQIHPLLEGEAKTEAPEGNELVDLRGRAAVCDMCSTLADQEPRCVYACPHEAAFRIEYRADFESMVLK